MEVCKKGLKDEQSRVKKLEVTLYQLHTELDQRFEETCGLKDQAYKDMKNTDLLKPLIDISSGKASSSSYESEYDEVGFDAHLSLKSTTPKPVSIKPIQAIHI